MNIVEKELGKGIVSFVCTNNSGMAVTILNLGGIVQSILLPNGEDVVLGLETPEEYLADSQYLGACVGPYAGVIENGAFSIESQDFSVEKNHGNHCLHSGTEGLHKKIFDYIIEGERLILYTQYDDLEIGIPGNMTVEITYKLMENNTLMVGYRSICDKDTILNVSNLPYFNLDGVKTGGNCLGNSLVIHGNQCVAMDGEGLATGEILEVSGTALDLREGKQLGESGIDGAFCFVVQEEKDMKLVAEAEGAVCSMKVLSDSPCVTLSLGGGFSSVSGKYGTIYEKNSGFSLSTGLYPNGINVEHFPCPIVNGGELWKYKTFYQFVMKELR